MVANASQLNPLVGLRVRFPSGSRTGRSSGLRVLGWCLATACAVAGIKVWPPVACAQSEGETAATSGSRLPNILSDGTIEPKARLYFSDKDSNLILVPDKLFEDYIDQSSSRAGEQAPGVPALAFEKIEVDLKVTGDVARLAAEFQVHLLQEVATSVNLLFGNVQLSRWSFTGESDKNLLQPPRDEFGWRWVLLGASNSTHTATLEGVTRVVRDADRRSLRIALPAAPCTISIQLPVNAVDVRVRPEDVLEPATPSGPDGKQFIVHSTGGAFTLSWRDQEAISQVAAVDADSSTAFSISDPTQPWLATTTLTIRWYGKDARDRIEIELPPGAQWQTLPKSEFERYRISIVDESASAPNPVGLKRNKSDAADTEQVDTENSDTGNSDTSSSNTAQTDNQPVQQEGAEAEDTSGVLTAPPPAVRLQLENFDVTRNEVIEIPFDWEWMPPASPNRGMTTEVSMPAPIIHGVDEHRGTIDCIVPSPYAVVFNQGAGARLTHQGPLVDFGRQQLQFEFDLQDFELSVIFRREQSLPTIRPTYLVNIDRNKLILTMWFDCSFDTQQPIEFGLSLDEWLIQENTARVVNDLSDPFSAEGEVLRVGQQEDRDFDYIISSAAAELGTFGSSRHIDQVWRVVAERSWSTEDHEVSFQVPRIIRGRANGTPDIDHGSGTLLVVSDSNVLLNWKGAGTLQRDSFSSEYQRYIREMGERRPLAYRFQSGGDTPVWDGSADLLPQEISVEQHAELEVVTSRLVIRQNFLLQIANEPLSVLRFAVRKDAGDTQPPQVLVNGNLVSSPLVGTVAEHELEAMLQAGKSASASAPGANGSTETPTQDAIWQIYQLLGGPELRGATEVTIHSSIIWRNGDQAATSELTPLLIDVPLAQLDLPGQTRFLSQDWTLTSDLQVEIVKEPDASGSIDQFVGNRRVRELAPAQRKLEIRLRPRRIPDVSPVRIGKSWLQTFVTGRGRRDRFVAQIETDADKLQLTLPEGANIREKKRVKVAVDGFSQTYNYDPATDIVTIPLNSRQPSHILEISYFLPDTLAWVTQLAVEPPTIQESEQYDRFYWQLLTPSVQHLGWSPSALTAEWTWVWSWMWWERDSELNQQQLEMQLGSEYQEPPPASANNYVMSGRELDERATVWIFSRFVLWFPVGLLAIAIAYTALNAPVIRKPVFVFVLAVALSGLAMIWPDMAMLAGQTAVISLGLVVLVWAVQAGVDSRVRRRSVFSARPSTYVERSDNFSVPRVRVAHPTVTHAGSSVASGGE